MSYRFEKETGDLIIEGFEQGIAPSPHKGMANLQGAEISTELGEVSASFNRISQLTSTGTASVTGTLTASSGDGNYVLASDTDMAVGQWINVTASTVTIPDTTYSVTYLAVGGGGGGGGVSNSGIYAGGGGGGGLVLTGTLSVSAIDYTITVGAGGSAGTTSGDNGGNGGDSIITHVTRAVITTDVTATGGGGGGGTSTTSGGNGSAGGNGGGGGAGNASDGAGGTGTHHNGGSGDKTSSNTGGGGGGDGAVGGSGSSGTAGSGGTGTASSISGSSVTYAGGGGGGAVSGTAGSGGTGGGGAGHTNGNGTAGTANTGGGGGGAGGSSSAHTGGAGGSGIVVISYTTGNITATGGTITTSGGNTIHTFTSSGTFSISAINTSSDLPTGDYFVDYSASGGSKVKISYSYDTDGSYPIYHGTTGTITFTTEPQFGNPVASATEIYNSTTTTYYRYYILDNNGTVWVNDTQNSLGWIATNPDTSYYSGQAKPSGLAYLGGWLLVFAGENIYSKPTTNLGTAWTTISNNGANNNIGTSTIPHAAFVGHQGRCYYTDGNFVGSIQPDNRTLTGGAANLQSFCTFHAQVPGSISGTVTDILDGSGPQVPLGDTYKIPVVLFTDDNGTVGTYITEGAVYWAADYDPATGQFGLYGASSSSSLTLAGGLSTGATSATLNTAWTEQTFVQPVSFSNGDQRNALFTNGSTTISWVTGLTSSASTSVTIGSQLVDTGTGASGTQYFNTFYPIGLNAGSGGYYPTLILNNQRLVLPSFETAQTITEIGNNILVGCKGNVVYPWNQVDTFPSGLIFIPEFNVQQLLTVNQIGYIFAGNRGNIYITDGSLASLAIKVPDYVAGIPGSPATYINPSFSWGGVAFIRGRVYFSILDHTSSKAGNCGGIWSFYPSQNLYIGQDTGSALRLEAQNSYGDYNGVASIILPAQTQNSTAPLYWTGYYSDVTSPVYGIDYTNTGTSSSQTLVVETDALPFGTFLDKKTWEQIEYKLSAPLDSGATVTAKYRTELTSAWVDCNSFITEPVYKLSGYAQANFQQSQWLQLQFTITPITSTASSNTFVRLRQIRIR